MKMKYKYESPPGPHHPSPTTDGSMCPCKTFSINIYAHRRCTSDVNIMRVFSCS